MNRCKAKWQNEFVTSVLFMSICFAIPANAISMPGAGVDDFVTVYREIVNKHLSTDTQNLNQALKQLDELAKRDSSNGTLHYIRASVYVRKGDWSTATRELKAGNSAARYKEYQRTGPLELNLYPGLARLRGMVNVAAKTAQSLGYAEGNALLSELRTMGTRITRTQPAESICPIAGVAMRIIAERALADLYQKNGKTVDAERMRIRQKTDTAWRKRAGALVDAQSPLDLDKNWRALASKHGISQSELAQWEQKGLSSEAKVRYAAFMKDANAQEHALTEQLIKSLPK